MPQSFSVINAVEKNKIASANSWIVLLEIQFVDTSTGQVAETKYVANNNEDLTYDSNVYVAFPFDIKLKQEAGGVPEITLTAQDFQKVLLSKMNKYSGASGSIVIMRIVNSDNLTAEPELEENFEVLDSSANDYVIAFKLGAENILTRRFPNSVQMRDRCRWRYKSDDCGYVGAEASCDLTLQGANGCSFHSNSPNFGGFPGLKGTGIRYG